MEDIIKQIVQIDAVAFNTRRGYEEALKLKKEQYEKQMQEYKESTLAEAREKAKEVYEQIVAVGMTRHHLEEEKCKMISLAVENHYLQVEEALLKQVFEELVVVEG